MSTFSTLHQAMVDRLTALESFRGTSVLSMDDHNYIQRLNVSLSKINGTAIGIGNPGGDNAAPDTPGGQFNTTIRVYIFENQELNRNRLVAGEAMQSVADEAGRLALTDLSVGQKVFQIDTSTYYWLLLEGGESETQNWAQLRVAVEWLELVLRAFQHWKPVDFMAMRSLGFEPGTLDDVHDFVARFGLRIGLESTELT